MKVIIVEDERLAAERLSGLILSADPSIEILAQFDSVEDTVSYFNNGSKVDLFFLDIQLADGKSFEIFEKLDISVPVIFTTAYDQYALQAFKHLSIDYLLKPVQIQHIQAALEKYKVMIQSQNVTLSKENVESLKSLLNQSVRTYKERLVVKAGQRLHFKPVKDISYFFADGKEAYVIAKGENRRHLIDYTLEELDSQLDPRQFFRINRKFILNVDVIAEVKGRVSRNLEVRLNQPTEHILTVSRERANDFRQWLDR